jgi:hypothetical protein
MAERAPLQQVVRRIRELRDAGIPAQQAAAEIQSLGWTPAEIKDRVSGLRPADTLDAVAQGASFGFADEISAGLRAPIRAFRDGTSFGDAYNSALEDSRTALDIYRNEAPVRSALSEFAGGAMVPVPGRAPRTFAGAIGKGATAGGVGGALYGAGTGEDGGNRLERAIVGGATGAALGGALGAGEGLVRGAIVQSPAGARGTSRAMLADALADEGMTGTQAADRIATARAAGSTGNTIMDVAQGGRVLGLFDDVANSPNRAQAAIKTQIEQRQMGVRGPTGNMDVPGQYERIAGRLGELAGVGDARAVQTLANIKARRSAEATPAFKEAWKFDPAADDTVRAMFAEVAQTPLFRDSWDRAVKIAQSKARGVPTPKLGEIIDEATGELRVIPNMQFMHFLKEGMDGSVNVAYRAGDGNLGSAYKEVRNLFRDTLKKQNPAYKGALDAFAGDKALEEAVEEGSRLMLKSPDELSAGFNGLSASEQDAFRVGAITKVLDVLAVPRRGPARDVAGALNSPAYIRKIAALMPDDAARQKWFAFADIEEAKSLTARTTGNSRTAGRQEVSELMDANESAGRMLADASQGMASGPWNMLVTALGKISKPIADFAKRQRRGAMGEMLMQTDTQAEAFLRGLDARPPAIGYRGPGMAAPLAIGANSQSPLLSAWAARPRAAGARPLVKYRYTDYEVEAEDNGTPGSSLVTRFPEGWGGNRVNDALRAMASAIRNLGDEAFRVPTDDDDNTTPLGTMSRQNASNVNITGGVISGVRGSLRVGHLTFWWGSFQSYADNYTGLLNEGWVIADGRTVRNPFTNANVTAPNFLGRYPKFGANALALSGAATQTTSIGGDHTHGGSTAAVGLIDANMPSGVLFEVGIGDPGGNFGSGSNSLNRIRSGTGLPHSHGIAAAGGHTHTVTMAPPTIELIPLARIF